MAAVGELIGERAPARASTSARGLTAMGAKYALCARGRDHRVPLPLDGVHVVQAPCRGDHAPAEVDTVAVHPRELHQAVHERPAAVPTLLPEQLEDHLAGRRGSALRLFARRLRVRPTRVSGATRRSPCSWAR